MHYSRLLRGNDPHKVVERSLPTEERFWAKVDKSGECWIWTAGVGSYSGDDTYGTFYCEGRMHTSSRWAYERFVSEIPDGYQVDHKYHTTLCVRPDHLQAVSRKENKENSKGAYRNSKTGVRGVTPSANGEKYLGHVRHNNELVYVGTFDTVEEAEREVVLKRNVLFTNNLIDRR